MSQPLESVRAKIAALRVPAPADAPPPPAPPSPIPSADPDAVYALAVVRRGGLWYTAKLRLVVDGPAEALRVVGPVEVVSVTDGDVRASALYDFKVMAARTFWTEPQ